MSRAKRKRMPAFRRRPVLVTWRDTTAFQRGWEPEASLAAVRPEVCRTVGFLVRRTPRHLVLAQSASEGGDAMGAVAIPRGFLVSVEVL